MIDPRVTLAVVAAGLVVSFGGGFTVSNWRASGQLAALKADHAQALAANIATTLAAQKKLDIRIGAIDTKETEALRVANAETDRLRTCIADGTCGLRIRAQCPATSVPRPGGARVGAGAGPELATDARQDYFTLRAAMTATERKLSACQSILKGST